MAQFPCRRLHHVPRQVGDFCSAQPSFQREQNNDAIAMWVTSSVGEIQEIIDVLMR
jgi:hypothetical protein